MFETKKTSEQKFREKTSEARKLINNFFLSDEFFDEKFRSNFLSGKDFESLKLSKEVQGREGAFITGKNAGMTSLESSKKLDKIAKQILNSLIEISEIEGKGSPLPPVVLGDYIAGEYHGSGKGVDGLVRIDNTRYFCVTKDPEVAKKEILGSLEHTLNLYKNEIEEFSKGKK